MITVEQMEIFYFLISLAVRVLFHIPTSSIVPLKKAPTPLVPSCGLPIALALFNVLKLNIISDLLLTKEPSTYSSVKVPLF